MILDYNYNKHKRQLSVSYIKDTGGKALINFNVERFKTYYRSPNGKFMNWDGSKCDVKYTTQPHKFDIRTFLTEMDESYKKLLTGKTPPKIYTFDIEIDYEKDVFPEPSEARYPISTISITSNELNTIVLGTKPLSEIEKTSVEQMFNDYVTNMSYFKQLDLKTPYIKYIKFDSEHDMLEYFLRNISAKVPALAGWNSLLFDWQYIQNRIMYYYPDLSISMGSIDNTTAKKKCEDQRGNKVTLTTPNHTLILDMMDIIGQFDMVVLPIKESLSLDYIASETIKAHKIQYDGTLDDLYEKDFPRYVFYNAIDSVLVQMIDMYFKTLQNIYIQALYCGEKIGSCFSKIALTEALIWQDFYEQGLKVVPEDRRSSERGTLVGAYVRQPIPGKYRYLCCNDFASLYPSSIITCNISYDNFIGHDFTQDEIDAFKKDSNYFVSVNGNVYKNDKIYSFKRIQLKLRNKRDVGKYLSKQLDALTLADIEHLMKNGCISKNITYPENVVESLTELGYNIKCSNDLIPIYEAGCEQFLSSLKKEILFLSGFEQSMKLLGNSMYGGSSHEACFWFNMELANDITGEARNLIHKMEYHIPEFLNNEWSNLTEVHKMLGITINPNKVNEIIKSGGNLAQIIYGDTDSLYISYENLLSTINGYEKMTLSEICNILVEFNTKFMDIHNFDYMKDYFNSRFVESVQKFELETIALSGIWLDVKKRYAQILLWKDGRFFDVDDLPMKVKGLEIIKSSVPTQARKGLKRMVRYLLEDDGTGFLIQRLNIKMMQEQQEWNNVDIEDVCGNMKVNGYTKYIIDDTNPSGLIVESKCPPNVKALGNYNRLRNIYNLPGDPLYGGKIKWYLYYPISSQKSKRGRGKGSMKNGTEQYFGFQSRNYPKWAAQYAPISRPAMFQQFMLDPFNRILEAINEPKLNIDGSIQCGFF